MNLDNSVKIQLVRVLETSSYEVLPSATNLYQIYLFQDFFCRSL